MKVRDENSEMVQDYMTCRMNKDGKNERCLRIVLWATAYYIPEDMRLMEAKRGTGDRFTVRYGVLTHHFGKDSVHDLPMEV